MPHYDYEILDTKEIIEVQQSIKDSALEFLYSPKKKKELPCKRLISKNYAGIVFQGDGWTVPLSGHGKRGYSGKFGGLVREKGHPVDGPQHAADAKNFQKAIDGGLLDGVPSSVKLSPKTKPMTGYEMIDKKHKR